ncbi:MAG: hypothetical protein R3F08_14235 [Dokdonella sp.]
MTEPYLEPLRHVVDIGRHFSKDPLPEIGHTHSASPWRPLAVRRLPRNQRTTAGRNCIDGTGVDQVIIGGIVGSLAVIIPGGRLDGGQGDECPSACDEAQSQQRDQTQYAPSQNHAPGESGTGTAPVEVMVRTGEALERGQMVLVEIDSQSNCTAHRNLHIGCHQLFQA